MTTTNRTDDGGRGTLLGVIGLACVLLGLYYMVWQPGITGEEDLRGLVAGQTAILAGVIFLAAAWRPRG